MRAALTRADTAADKSADGSPDTRIGDATDRDGGGGAAGGVDTSATATNDAHLAALATQPLLQRVVCALNQNHAPFMTLCEWAATSGLITPTSARWRPSSEIKQGQPTPPRLISVACRVSNKAPPRRHVEKVQTVELVRVPWCAVVPW